MNFKTYNDETRYILTELKIIVFLEYGERKRIIRYGFSAHLENVTEKAIVAVKIYVTSLLHLYLTKNVNVLKYHKLQLYIQVV